MQIHYAIISKYERLSPRMLCIGTFVPVTAGDIGQNKLTPIKGQISETIDVLNYINMAAYENGVRLCAHAV